MAETTTTAEVTNTGAPRCPFCKIPLDYTLEPTKDPNTYHAQLTKRAARHVTSRHEAKVPTE